MSESKGNSNVNLYTDRELVEGCIADDRKFQEILYRKFAPEMYKVVTRYASCRDEAMDFLQNGFIAVFKDIHKFKFEGSLEGWVRRVVVYRTIDQLRKEKRYQEVISEANFSDVEEAFEFEIDTSNEKLARIIKIVNDLPKKAGLILKLYALEGYTHKEIAEILEISVGTSKSQLNRARLMVKESLEGKNE